MVMRVGFAFVIHISKSERELGGQAQYRNICLIMLNYYFFQKYLEFRCVMSTPIAFRKVFAVYLILDKLGPNQLN